MIAEVQRLAEDATREKNWKRWGPYLAERTLQFQGFGGGGGMWCQASCLTVRPASSRPEQRSRPVERRRMIPRPRPLLRAFPPGWKPRLTGRQDAPRHLTAARGRDRGCEGTRPATREGRRRSAAAACPIFLLLAPFFLTVLAPISHRYCSTPARKSPPAPRETFNFRAAERIGWLRADYWFVDIGCRRGLQNRRQ